MMFSAPEPKVCARCKKEKSAYDFSLKSAVCCECRKEERKKAKEKDGLLQWARRNPPTELRRSSRNPLGGLPPGGTSPK